MSTHDDATMKTVPLKDRFGMLVDVEYTNRKNSRLKRLIKNAELGQPDASIMDINYTSGRKLNKELINRLATCEYTCASIQWLDFISGKASAYPYKLHGRTATNIYAGISMPLATS